jgi:hypothetical protein
MCLLSNTHAQKFLANKPLGNDYSERIHQTMNLASILIILKEYHWGNDILLPQDNKKYQRMCKTFLDIACWRVR